MLDLDTFLAQGGLSRSALGYTTGGNTMTQNDYEQAVIEAAEAWNAWMNDERPDASLVHVITKLRQAVDDLHQYTDASVAELAERDADTQREGH